MSPDILFVLLPPWGVSMPHLGLAYLSSYLTKKGYATKILDLNNFLYDSVDDPHRILWPEMDHFKFWMSEKFLVDFMKRFSRSFEQCYEMILKTPSTVISFSVNAANQLLTILFVLELRRRGDFRKVIFGGPSCFQGFDNAIFKDTADIFVIGEGETVLLEVMDALYSHKPVQKIAGVYLPADSSHYYPQTDTCDLGEIGYPTFEEFDLNNYIDILPILFGRGCINKCAFCNDHFFWGNYRGRKAVSIVDEIAYHVRVNKISSFFVNDLLINADVKLLHEICDLLIERKLTISFEGQALIRKEMDIGLLKKLKKAGCTHIAYGVESFSDRILAAMKKPFRAVLVDQVLKNTHRAGIKTKIGIIVGFPGETEDDFSMTLAGIARNEIYIDEVSNIAPCLVNEGTDLRNCKESYGIYFNDSEDRYFNWSDDVNNDYNMRKKRLKEALVFLKERRIKNALVNIYDESFEKQKNELKRIYR